MRRAFHLPIVVAACSAVSIAVTTQIGAQTGTTTQITKAVKPVVVVKPATIHLTVEPPLKLTTVVPPPKKLTPGELTATLKNYGLQLTAVAEPSSAHVTMAAAKTPMADLTVWYPMSTTTLGVDGWAVIGTKPAGWVEVMASVTPGERYLFDIAVGELLPDPTGMRKYELVIRPDWVKADAQVEELVLAKGGQHLLAIVEAKTKGASVTVKGFNPDTGAPDVFVFHSADISKLK